MIRWLAPVLLLITVASAHAQLPLDMTLDHLANVDACAMGGIGFSNITSPGEKDYKKLMAERPEIALKLFEDLYVRGNPQGKCYALLAIHHLALAKFAEVYLPLAMASNESVKTIHGCVGGDEPLGQIAKRLQKGEGL